MPEYSFTLALFITASGLAYHMLFILAPTDLMNKRLPAIVAILSWLLLGVVAGALVPMTYNLWNDYILATIVGIVFILMGATLGHIVLNITRRRAQKEVEYIAMGIWENNENE